MSAITRPRALATCATIAITAATGLLVAGTPAASAAAPAITSKSCAMQGGTYTFVRGVKSCRVTVTYRIDHYGPGSFEDPSGLWRLSWYLDWVLQNTTTRHQKGNGPVSTDPVDTQIIHQTVVDRTCDAWVEQPEVGGGYWQATDPAACASLYPDEF